MLLLRRRRLRLIATLALLIATTAARRRALLVTVLAFHRRALDIAALRRALELTALALLVVSTATHHALRRTLLVATLAAALRRTLEVSTLILLAATLTALPHGRPHLFQLLQLLGGQDLLEFRLGFGLQVRHLFLLVGREVQLLLGEGGHQPEPTRHATALTIAGAAFITGPKLLAGALIVSTAGFRSSTVLRSSRLVVAVADLRATLRGRGRRRRSAGVLLRGRVERHEAERQRGGGDEFLHEMVPFNHFSSRLSSLDQS